MQGIVFDGNINHRKAYFKQIYEGQHEPEVVIEDWLRRFCNSWLKEEFYVQSGAGYYERTPIRRDYGNGYYKRRMLTRSGRIDILVPRGKYYRCKYTLFEKYKRYSRQFEDIVVDSLLLGHSTRDAKRFFDEMFGQGSMSHSLASKILRRFDSEIEVWKKRRIEKEVAILVLDAVHLKGAITGLRRAKPVLCAYCIYKDGTEELIDFEVASHESTDSYSRFCGKLYARGLRQIELVVRDDHKGIREAITTYWPEATQQLCVFHLMQNFVKQLKGFDRNRRRRIITAVSQLYESKDKTAFYGNLRYVMSCYRQLRYHRAFCYLYAHLEETTQFYKIGKEFQPAAKTTNRLERLFKEVKRRVKAFGRFPNTMSCQRWLYALIKEGLTPQYKPIKSTQLS